MTLIISTDAAGNECVRMTACPYCQEPISTQTAFRQHWPHCVANPEASNAD